jgi:hypothetical protein
MEPDDLPTDRSLGYWETKYWELLEYAQEQLGQAFAMGLQVRNLPTNQQDVP